MFRVSPAHVEATLQLSSADLYEALGLERDRPATATELETRRDRLGRYVADRVHLGDGAARCAPSPAGVERLDKADGFFAVVRLEYRCPRRLEGLVIEYQLFFDVDPRHQGIARIELPGGQVREHLFRRSAERLELAIDHPPPASLAAQLLDYLRLGVEHIFTGYDHLCFLLGLLLVVATVRHRDEARPRLATQVRGIVGIVTSFTVAHSLTLVAAALGHLELPSRWVESAIALSIVWVGVENLLVAAPARRWLLTFGFGLIHGLGFASALRDVGLPERGLIPCLISFNVGVELGQIAVVMAAMPLLLWLDRLAPRLRLRWAGSTLVTLLGLAWALERLLGRG